MRRVLVIAMAVLAGGCSIFGDDDEPIEPPAELQKFDATHQVGRAWRKGLGGGTESLLLGLRPAVSGGRPAYGRKREKSGVAKSPASLFP